MTFKSFKTFLEDVQISRKEKEAIATVTGKDSEKFTKIAKKLLEIEMAEKRIKELREEIKQHTREDIAALFEEAADRFRTRRVETMSVVLTLSKDPDPRRTVSWKAVVDELLELVTDLNEKIQELIAKHTKLVYAEPSLTVSQIKNPEIFKDLGEKIINLAISDGNESGSTSTEVLNENVWDKIKNYFNKLWAFFKRYDVKLANIKRKIEKYRLEA